MRINVYSSTFQNKNKKPSPYTNSSTSYSPSHQNKQAATKRRTRSNTQKLKATNDAITHLTQNIRLVISNFI